MIENLAFLLLGIVAGVFLHIGEAAMLRDMQYIKDNANTALLEHERAEQAEARLAALAGALTWVRRRVRFYVPEDSGIRDGRNIPRYGVEDIIEALDTALTPDITALLERWRKEQAVIEAARKCRILRTPDGRKFAPIFGNVQALEDALADLDKGGPDATNGGLTV